MEENVSYSTFQAFRPHFDALARVAYFKIVLKILSPIKRTIHEACRILVWVLILLYNLQHFIRLVQVRHSTDKIVDTLFILFTTLNALGKQIAFNARSRRIDNIISVIDGPGFSPRNRYHVEVMKDNAVMMHRLLKFNIGCVISCGTLWTIFPLVNRAMGEEVEFTGYIPFDTTSSLKFQLTLAYMSILITFQAYGHVTMDSTIVAFYAQAKVQLQMLRYNLEHLVDLDCVQASGKEQDHNMYEDLKNTNNGKLLKKKLIDCVKHHQCILWFVREIESIFTEAMLFQLFVTAWVICMTAYKIVDLSLFSAEFFSMAIYLACMLSQSFLYCYYGTQVKYESDFINRSIYAANWLSLSPAFRRQLQIMMVNGFQPIVIQTAYIIPFTLETYISVLRASYTLFTFLRQK